MDILVGIIEPDTGPVIMYFVTGINGLLGKGEIGSKLELNLNKFDISVDTFFIIEAFGVSHFLRIEIEIKLSFLTTNYIFYIFNQRFVGLKIEDHKIFKKIITELLEFAFVLGSDPLGGLSLHDNYKN